MRQLQQLVIKVTIFTLCSSIFTPESIKIYLPLICMTCLNRMLFLKPCWLAYVSQLFLLNIQRDLTVLLLELRTFKCLNIYFS